MDYNTPDYTVQFANLRRVAENIQEPWKSELEDEIASLAEAIEEDLEERRKAVAAIPEVILD